MNALQKIAAAVAALRTGKQHMPAAERNPYKSNYTVRRGRARNPHVNLLLQIGLTRPEISTVFDKYNASLTKTGAQAMLSNGKAIAKSRTKCELVKLARKMFKVELAQRAAQP